MRSNERVAEISGSETEAAERNRAPVRRTTGTSACRRARTQVRFHGNELLHRPPYGFHSFSWRTTKTGQWACLTTESETLPVRDRLIPPLPLLPMTIRPAPSSCA